MKLLAIDCSLNNVGIAVFDETTPIYIDLHENSSITAKLKTDALTMKIESSIKYIQKMIDDYNIDIISIEKPTGSQSAAGLISYTVECAIFAHFKSLNYSISYISALSAKEALTGDKNASKKDMIDNAIKRFPNLQWIKKKSKVLNKNEHMADAIAIGIATK